MAELRELLPDLEARPRGGAQVSDCGSRVSGREDTGDRAVAGSPVVRSGGVGQNEALRHLVSRSGRPLAGL